MGLLYTLWRIRRGDKHTYNFCIRKVSDDVSLDFKVITTQSLLSPVTEDETGCRFNIDESDERAGIADIVESCFTIKEFRGDLCVCPASGDFLTFRVRLPKEALKEYFNTVRLIADGLEV